MLLAQEKCQSEHLRITQEKEQQESLALEELELQKKAILTESENKLQDIQQEAETYRTVSLYNIQAPELKLVEYENYVLSPLVEKPCFTELDLHIHALHFL